MSKKTEVVRVHFMDNSCKAFAVDPSTTADDFRSIIIKRLDLSIDDCFALFEKKNNWERCLDGDERPVELMKHWDSDSKKGDKCMFIFKKKIFLKDDEREMEDPVAKDLVYIQAVHDVIEGLYDVSVEDAAALAGLQVQVVFGDHNPTTHISGFLTNNKDIENFVPRNLYASKKAGEWEALILKEHAKHRGVSQEDAKTLYLNVCKSFPLWGTTFYPPCKSNGNRNLPSKVIIGVNFEGIRLLKPKTKEIISEHLYTEICSWASSSGTFGFEFGNQSDSQKYTFDTRYGAIIAATVQTYIDILVQMLRQGSASDEGSSEGGA